MMNFLQNLPFARPRNVLMSVAVRNDLQAANRITQFQARKLRSLFAALTLASLVAVLFPAPASSQTQDQIDQANREFDRIQQEQRERLENERRERLSNQPRTRIEVPERPEIEGDKQGPCRDISDIQIDGATLLREDDRTRIVSPYVGTCMAVSNVERLLADITNHYVRKGYIGARAYVQTQDLNKGLLRVLVLEGRISGLRLEDGGVESVNLETAFPGVVGEPMNLRDFEQGLDQLNRLLSNRATLQVEPGEEPGDTVAVIYNTPGELPNANWTADNFGSDSTGRNQAGLVLMMDHLAGLNDGLLVSHRRSLVSDYSEQNSQTTSVLYSVPYGYFTLTASQVFNQYATTLDLPTISLRSEGRSSTSSMQLSYVAYRDRVNSLWLESTVTVKSNDNFLAGQKLAVSSRILSNINLRGTWNTRLWDGQLSVGLDYVRGLEAFGGYEDPAGLPDDAPHAQFDKWQTLTTWSKPFEWRDRLFIHSSTLSGQWSEDVLYGQDQFLVGSIFSVRGFRDTSISGDRGFYWRNDLMTPIPSRVFGVSVNLRPSIGLDIGRVYPHESQPGGTLAGATLGLAASIANVGLDLKAVAPLHKPDAFPDEGTHLYFNLRYSY